MNQFASFSDESVEAVLQMLEQSFACGSSKGPTTQRTPAQKAGDAARAAKLRGRDNVPPATRSAAAKKAAATRKANGC